MSEAQEREACRHEHIRMWRDAKTGEPVGLWSCANCERRFEPVQAARSQQHQQEEWRPISEAPRDGQPSLGASASPTALSAPAADAASASIAGAVPTNASDIRAFIGSNFGVLEYGRPDHAADDDDCYSVTAHDLLSSFDDWFDARGIEADARRAGAESPVPSGTRPEESAEPPALDGGER